MTSPRASILSSHEPAAVEIVNPGGTSSALLLCDHASPRVPEKLAGLGLAEEVRLQHIGWDIGAANVARRLSELLDATLILSGYSRLVIDCNRPPGSPTSIPVESGGVLIPGNAAVSAEEAAAREEECFWPYHRAIHQTLEERQARGAPTVLFSVHSFTPSLLGKDRPWHAAILYGKDRRLPGHFIDALRAMPELVIGDNEPYQVTDAGDFAIPAYGERRGLHCVLVEMRQNEVATMEGAHAWAARLAEVYNQVEPRLGVR